MIPPAALLLVLAQPASVAAPQPIAPAAVGAPAPHRLQEAPGAQWICDPEHERWRREDLALAQADLPKGPKGAIADLSRLEAALAHAPAQRPGDFAVCDGRPIAFDGPGGLLLLLSAAAERRQVTVDRRPLPYARLALLVGSAYDELGRMAEALPALDRGLAVAPNDLSLEGEKAFALVQLRRENEAADLCARAIADAPRALPDTDNPLLLARLHRLRGYALGELGRFDEAIGEYRASKAIDPAETISANEITYLEGRKAGRPATAVRSTTTDQVRKPQG